ncbi:hypothetical protein [Halorhodospira neutriphila]|uniref:GATA-type domain-containing protein n=1 Tax=Halorhodospira neutriphila TaxID=168379 RepID=A0ABS1E7T3_9GAMM|nr:hypothetical protein [Halorhodospira neutriphila]MBK1726805.1 hypothetical protein [Halorhodospira neutriphila]
MSLRDAVSDLLDDAAEPEPHPQPWSVEPEAPCSTCGSGRWWQDRAGGWWCEQCTPFESGQWARLVELPEGERPAPLPVTDEELADSQPWTAAEAEEAAEERAAIVEEATGASAEEVARKAQAFYRHLFGVARETGCYNGTYGRYCEEGARLKRAYEDAAAACDVSFPEWTAALAKVREHGGTA